MSFRKAFAITAVVVVLGFQAWTIFPPGWGRPHYWPFVDYPMYSGAYHVGDSVVHRELRATPCGAPGAPVTLDIDSFPMEPWRLWSMIDRLAASPAPAPILDTVGRLTRSAIHRNPCALAIWQQVVVVRRQGVRLDDTTWRQFRAWPLGPDSARGGVSPPGERR